MSDFFTERYQNFSNIELQRIIENPGSYQPQAVEAAKEVLAGRQLPESEMEALKVQIATEKQAKQREDQKKKEFEGKLRAAGQSVFAAVNPIQEKGLQASDSIRTLTILFTIVSIYQLCRQFDMVLFMFSGNGARWDFSMVTLWLIPLLLPPIATILFHLRKKMGWFLMVTFLVLSLVGCLRMFFYEMAFSVEIYMGTPTIVYIAVMLLYAVLLWVICNDNIRQVYNVSTNFMVKTLLYVAVISSIVMYLSSAL